MVLADHAHDPRWRGPKRGSGNRVESGPCCFEHRSINGSTGTGEDHLGVGCHRVESLGDRKPGAEMAARATTCQDDGAPHAGPASTSGADEGS